MRGQFMLLDAHEWVPISPTVRAVWIAGTQVYPLDPPPWKRSKRR